MENLRHRRHTRFLTSEAEAKRCTLKPNFLNFQIINDNLVSVNFSQLSIFWNKPTPVGAAILDLSKILLYNFHYTEMKPKFGASLTAVYKDTDSLLYRIETDDLYRDMESFKSLLDLSDYPPDHKLYDPTNKKVPLTMKDELNSEVMLECTCLRSKLYSIKFQSGVKQSAKGVQKSVKKSLHHDLFTEVLSSKRSVEKLMTQIQSKQHQLLVTQVKKKALSAFDDKRFILDCGVQSSAYGHYSLGQSSIADLCLALVAWPQVNE